MSRFFCSFFLISHIHSYVRKGSVLALCAALTACIAFNDHTRYANARLRPALEHNVQGVVMFAEGGDGVQVTYNIIGLTPNTDHAFQIHERGDCNVIDVSSVGAVFNPDHLPTGHRHYGVRTEGEMPNLRADANGVATGFVIMPAMSLNGVHSVVGRAVVIYRDADDTDPPSSNPGSLIACGVIRK